MANYYKMHPSLANHLLMLGNGVDMKGQPENWTSHGLVIKDSRHDSLDKVSQSLVILDKG